MKTEYKGVTVHVMRHFYANSELKDASLIPDRSVVLALLGIIYKMGFCLLEILAMEWRVQHIENPAPLTFK